MYFPICLKFRVNCLHIMQGNTNEFLREGWSFLWGEKKNNSAACTCWVIECTTGIPEGSYTSYWLLSLKEKITKIQTSRRRPVGLLAIR